MTSYYIFKTDYISGKTTLVCGGCHNDAEECGIHWQSYMYGFMDAAFELLGSANFDMISGDRPMFFQIHIKGQKTVDYFMLLDKEGQDLVYEISK